MSNTDGTTARETATSNELLGLRARPLDEPAADDVAGWLAYGYGGGHDDLIANLAASIEGDLGTLIVAIHGGGELQMTDAGVCDQLHRISMRAKAIVALREQSDMRRRTSVAGASPARKATRDEVERQ